MAITFDSTTTDQIDLRDFLDLVDASGGEVTQELLISHADNLRMLSNNRQFLTDIIKKELTDIYDFQPKNNYTAQTIMLGGVSNKFYVRANVWLPARLLHRVNGDSEKRLYSFERAHDHNFEFVTVGYLGAGYQTDIYEYDGRCDGLIGEHVELSLLERTSLPQHKVMLYRASRDVHIQKMPVNDFSISLNLLGTPIEGSKQYVFDLESGRIDSILRANHIGQCWIIEAAGYLCDDNITDVLASIAKKHRSVETREAARKALSIRYPEITSECD